MIPSLYAICLDYLKHHSELISSFENVPFQPIVYTVLEHVFTSTLPLNTNLLGAVSRFGHELRQLDTPWTRLVLSRAATGRSALPSLIATSQLCPQFITCLKLGSCGLRDQDLYRLKEFAHLQVLDVGHNPLITDRGVSYIVTMATLGIHGLQDLYLSHLPGVTDKSLKYVGQLESLVYLDLSKTDVTEQVATTYLTMQGFRKLANLPSARTMTLFPAQLNPKLHGLIRQASVAYAVGNLPSRPALSYEESIGAIDTTSILHYRRCHGANKRPRPSKPNMPTKRQRPTTTDYLALIEKELLFQK